MEDITPTFMISNKWTDQGIRTIKDEKKRISASRDLAKKVGVEVKQLWLTNGESDLVPLSKRRAPTTSLNLR